ncbi:MAG: ATP-binding cassette domain-containing protein [Candidatus Gracilibacteria bacterium]|jgi:ATPase subunit of ABC transporter with duplicated ATPase domains
MANTIISFDEVTFGFDEKKPLLKEVSFNVREGAKITLMGQNGAGKSTILKLITGDHKASRGQVNVFPGYTIGTAHQTMRAKDRELTVEQFFQNCFSEKKYDIGRRIDEVLDIVNLKAPHDRLVKSFSGGQQARLLLAAALIQDPDLLLLDEPTNNLDPEGIAHLTYFLQCSPKTCIVISHDADFLNAFTEGVLYLDIHTKQVEQYVGDYYAVVEQIKARIEKENMKNAQLEKEILANKEQSNAFAHKGGKLRLVAKKMRDKAAELEESMVDVRREDKAIRPFTIPAQEKLIGEILKISSVTSFKHHEEVTKKVSVSLHKNQHLLLSGPNGIGKSTLLEALANGTAPGAQIGKDVKVGYYRQDFSNLDFEDTVLNTLNKATNSKTEQEIRALAASFLITGDIVHRKIGSLSEGQKGLVAFARLVLEAPGLLILDEPTNHINFRHLPVIAKALNDYEGAMVLVSHVWDFVNQIRIDHILDLEK